MAVCRNRFFLRTIMTLRHPVNSYLNLQTRTSHHKLYEDQSKRNQNLILP